MNYSNIFSFVATFSTTDEKILYYPKQKIISNSKTVENLLKKSNQIIEIPFTKSEIKGAFKLFDNEIKLMDLELSSLIQIIEWFDLKPSFIDDIIEFSAENNDHIMSIIHGIDMLKFIESNLKLSESQTSSNLSRRGGRSVRTPYGKSELEDDQLKEPKKTKDFIIFAE